MPSNIPVDPTKVPTGGWYSGASGSQFMPGMALPGGPGGVQAAPGTNLWWSGATVGNNVAPGMTPNQYTASPGVISMAGSFTPVQLKQMYDMTQNPYGYTGIPLTMPTGKPVKITIPNTGAPGTAPLGGPNPLQYSGAGGIDINTLSQTLQALNASQTAAYQKNLQQNAGALRDLVLKSSPELQTLSNYLTERMDKGLSPTELTDYQNAFRDSAAGGGWGNYATSEALPSQEAGYITRVQEQARQAILPQLQSFGQSMLGMTGFQAPEPVSASSVLSYYQNQQQAAMQAAQFQQNFQLQQAQFEAELQAAKEQSTFSRQQYNDQQRRIAEFERLLKVQAGSDLQRQQAQFSPFSLPGNPFSYNKPMAGNPATFFSNSWELDPNVLSQAAPWPRY